MDSFTFSGTAGDRVMIAGAMTSGLLDPQVRLYGPDGNMLCQNFSTSGGMAEIYDCPLPSNGTYTILFADYGYSETGNYGLYLQRLNNPENYTILDYGQNTGGDISIAPEMDTFTFSGVAGDRVLINMAVTLGALILKFGCTGRMAPCSAVHLTATADRRKLTTARFPIRGPIPFWSTILAIPKRGLTVLYLQRLTGALDPTPLSFGLPITADITLSR